MASIADFTFDASSMSWQEFVDSMLEIKSASELGGVSAQIRPPRRCAAEARRIIRDLDLTDCVELIESSREPQVLGSSIVCSNAHGALVGGLGRLLRSAATRWARRAGPLLRDLI